MPKIFPRCREGDQVSPHLFNMIFAELERWRNVICVAPLMVEDAEGEHSPVFSVDDNDDPVLICQPSSSVSGATGSWPAITPVSFTADVYQVYGTTMVKIAASATVYNWLAASLAANKTCFLEADGSGSYVTISQSCT